MPISSSLEVDLLLDALGNSRPDYYKNNRIIHLGDHVVAAFIYEKIIGLPILYDRLGNTLATFDATFDLIAIENIIDGVNVEYRIIGTVISDRGDGNPVLNLGYYTLTFPEDSGQVSEILNGVSLGVIDLNTFTIITNYTGNVTVVGSFIANTDESNTTNLYFGDVNLQQGTQGVPLVVNKHILNSSGVTTEILFQQNLQNFSIDTITIADSSFENSILRKSGNYFVMSFIASYNANTGAVSKPALLIWDTINNTPTLTFASDQSREIISSLEIVGNNVFYTVEDSTGEVQDLKHYNLITNGYLSVPKLESQLYTTINNQPVEQYPVDFDLCTTDCNSNDFSSLVNYNPNDTSISNITGLLKHPNGHIYISTNQAPTGGQYLSRVLNPTSHAPLYALHISRIIVNNAAISTARSQDAVDFRGIVGQSGGIIEDPDDTFDSAFQMPLFACIDPEYSHWCGYSQEDADDAAAGANIYHNTNYCGQEPS